jgi:hypothetical protein
MFVLIFACSLELVYACYVLWVLYESNTYNTRMDES